MEEVTEFAIFEESIENLDSFYWNITTTTGNSTSAPSIYYPLLKQTHYMVAIYSIVYIAVFILAILGNVLVALVVFKNPRMQTVTNFFIVNLAIADILVSVFCLPFTLISNLFYGWHFGSFLCKLVPFLQGTSVIASVNTLAAIALDKYLAICQYRRFKITSHTAKLIVAGIWLFATCSTVPCLVHYREVKYSSDVQELYVCREVWYTKQAKHMYFLVMFIVSYCVPLLLIVVCYARIGIKVWKRELPGIVTPATSTIRRSKLQVLKMLVVVVVVFMLSWLPLYAVHLALYFGNVPSMHKALVGDFVIPISQWLGSSNSCVNPLIYCRFSNNYRKGFKNISSNRCTNSSYFFDNFQHRRNSSRRRQHGLRSSFTTYGHNNKESGNNHLLVPLNQIVNKNNITNINQSTELTSV